jgi:transposase
MRRIVDVLRYHFDKQLGQRQIARTLHLSQSTVHHYLTLFEKAGLNWPLPEGMQQQQLEKALFQNSVRPETKRLATPDFQHIERELQQHRNLTLQLLWEEYRKQHAGGGYCYSRFCVQYRRWKRSQDVVMRQDHRAGEKLFVDWAGDTIPIYDRSGGPVLQSALFVAALGASSYTYAELCASQKLEDWLGAHMRALEFLQGVPALVIPDNVKTGVSKPCRYDPDLNPTYQEFALHYGFGVVPARPYKARDKAVVEQAVQVAQRWIVAAVRHHHFFSLQEGNQAVRELLNRLNQRPFRKREGSRASVFAAVDQPALQPLPAERYDMSQWSRARVNIDHHIAFDGNFYSVPYQLVGKEVEVRSTARTVEIFHRRERVASHTRLYSENKAQTIHEHRPASHQAYLEWTPERLVEWAAKVGAKTALLVQHILGDYPHPQMGFRSCLGVIRLAKHYSADRMEAAAQRALATGACRYRSVKSILANGLDQQPLPGNDSETSSTPSHDNIRGPEYFE